MKSDPRSQPHCLYHSLACSFDQTSRTDFGASMVISFSFGLLQPASTPAARIKIRNNDLRYLILFGFGSTRVCRSNTLLSIEYEIGQLSHQGKQNRRIFYKK